MTKDEFFIRFGEDPEEVLGPDWEEFVEEFLIKKKDSTNKDKTSFIESD